MSRWSLVVDEDFTSPAAEGFVDTVYPGRFGLYGPHESSSGGMWLPDNWSVSGGLLRLHNHSVAGEITSGGLSVKLPPSVSPDGDHMLYGRSAVRMRAASTMPGYGSAVIWWPRDRWPESGELDFPEGPFDGTVNAFTHFTGAVDGGDQSAIETSYVWTDWHEYVTEWTPDSVTYLVDGVVIGTEYNRLPTTPMKFCIQSGIHDTGSPPSLAVDGYLEIDYLRIWDYVRTDSKMAITTADALVAASRQVVAVTKTATATTVASQPHTLLDRAGNPGAGSLSVGNTTAGVLVSDAVAGFPAIDTFGSGAVGYLHTVSLGSTVACRLAMKDRIWHAGSVSMTSLATTTFSGIPDLTGRFPDGQGVGCEIWLEINTAVSATATTIAVGYTNSDGTTGRSTGATASLSGFATGRLVQMPLQAGDKGVRQVTSVTVGGTVASAGTFNVIVARPLFLGRLSTANDGRVHGPDATGLVRVYDTSALWPVVYADSTSSGVPNIEMTIVNG